MKKVAVCILSTGKYKVYVQPLIDSICKYFLLRHQITIHLFTDNLENIYTGNERVEILKDLIPAYRFPEITLFRYRIMCSRLYDCDYLYYFDADYLFVSEVDEEIFGDGLVAVLHPGFSCMGGGSWCDDKNSNAYTFPEFRQYYFCGGTQGGSYEHYYRAMKRMEREIDDDDKRGVRCEWNDEQHWNRLLSEHKSFKVLNSSYCMPQPESLRHAWKIDHLPPKILALDKNHKSMRE